MNRMLVGACAVALCTLLAPELTAATLDVRALPMHFELRLDGPPEICGRQCRTWVAASGAITSETARDFEVFAQQHDVRGATLVLDSDGGSVIGALALGRVVRRLEMVTTVARLSDLPPSGNGVRRARLVPRAFCESMCAFVLLAGVERYVPAEARVMVHQIWLGDRRDDPTAANYSAEDLVLVQRDIGRLAQYTVEMGGGIDLLETALKIPPWEPMRQLSRGELRSMNIVTADEVPASPASVATAAPALSNGSRVALGERIWAINDVSGAPMLSRRHPLTLEGDDIGSFELSFGCGETVNEYNVAYVEQRRAGAGGRGPTPLTGVDLSFAGRVVPLKIASSQTLGSPRELRSIAHGRVPIELVRAFADARSRSITVETANRDIATNIRIGNVGIANNFRKLADFCTGRDKIRSTELRTGKIAADQPR